MHVLIQPLCKEKENDEFSPLHQDGEVDVLVEKAVKKPSMYMVVMLNDDYTPMEFVVWILQKVFYMSQTESEHVMMKIHQTGQASCGSYTYDVAQTKIVWVHQLAEKHQHPLQCQLKEAISDEH